MKQMTVNASGHVDHKIYAWIRFCQRQAVMATHTTLTSSHHTHKGKLKSGLNLEPDHWKKERNLSPPQEVNVDRLGVSFNLLVPLFTGVQRQNPPDSSHECGLHLKTGKHLYTPFCAWLRQKERVATGRLLWWNRHFFRLIVVFLFVQIDRDFDFAMLRLPIAFLCGSRVGKPADAKIEPPPLW